MRNKYHYKKNLPRPTTKDIDTYDNKQTLEVKPLSSVRCSLMKPLMTTYIPSAVSRENSSYLLIIVAELNTRTASSLNYNNKYVFIKTLETIIIDIIFVEHDNLISVKNR
jgi:hypothetical protein